MVGYGGEEEYLEGMTVVILSEFSDASLNACWCNYFAVKLENFVFFIMV